MSEYFPGDLIELDNGSIWLIQSDLAGLLIRGDWVPGDMENVLATRQPFLLHRGTVWAQRDHLRAERDEARSRLLILADEHAASEYAAKLALDRAHFERDAALAKIQEMQNDAARLEHTADAACSAREQMRDENAALRKQGDLDRAHLTIAQAKIQRIKAAIDLLDQPGPYVLPEGHTGCEDIITGLAATALKAALADPEQESDHAMDRYEAASLAWEQAHPAGPEDRNEP